MNIYIIIYLPHGYMVADLSQLESSDQASYIDSIPHDHPVAIVRFTDESHEIEVIYGDESVKVDGVQDPTDVLEICTKVTGLPEISLENYIDKDLSQLYIDFDPSLLESPVTPSSPPISDDRPSTFPGESGDTDDRQSSPPISDDRPSTSLPISDDRPSTFPGESDDIGYSTTERHLPEESDDDVGYSTTERHIQGGSEDRTLRDEIETLKIQINQLSNQVLQLATQYGLIRDGTL